MPATRGLDEPAPGRALVPHTVPLANLPFDLALEGAIRKSVLLPPARGGTEPTKCPLCADKYYTSGAVLEHLAWHAVPTAAPAEDKEVASHILPGRVRRSSWHAPYAQRPPLPSGWPRGGPRSLRGSPSGVHSRETGPPVGPPGSGLPTPHGPGTPRGPGCPSGPRGNAGTGQLTAGGRGGRRPLALRLEPARRPRPPDPSLRDTL